MIKNTIFMAVAALALCGCGQNGTKKTGQATGADRDGHDCIGSAGYQWSEARKDCIRPFEDGVKMLPTTQSDTGAVYAAYIVFSADSAQAELFLPGNEKTEVLDRRDLPGGGHAWNVEDDDTKNVRLANGRWIIEQRGKTLYEQYEAPITTLFEGTDGKSRRRFRVEVRFSAGRAEVTLDGTVTLKQSDMPAQGNGQLVDAEVTGFISSKYPGARIVEYDYDKGLLEVEIWHENREKDVYFNGRNEWVYTEWDIRRSELPQAVTAAIATSEWATFSIDDIEYVQTPTAEYYLVELERGNREIELRIAAEGTIL